jgi:pyruvate-formate lyase-activating enzyme
MSVSQVFEIIEKTRPFISGITISGGECTVQYDFLTELLKEAKHRNISTFIDTNANLPEDKMIELSQYFDKAMPDLKAFDSTEHIKLTGKSSDTILRNIEFLLKNDKVHEVRTVIYSDFEKCRKTLFFANFLIRKCNPEVPYKIIGYRKHGTRNSDLTHEPSDDTMLKIRLYLSSRDFFNFKII